MSASNNNHRRRHRNKSAPAVPRLPSVQPPADDVSDSSELPDLVSAVPRSPRPLQRVEDGYMHKTISTPMAPGRKSEFRVLEKFLGRRVSIKVFESTYKNPFGSERGIRYHFDPSTNLLTFAGAVWNYPEPQRPIANKVLRSLVDDNFEKRSITVQLDSTPMSMVELSAIIKRFSCVLGMTSDCPRYKQAHRLVELKERRKTSERFQRQLARNARKLQAEANPSNSKSSKKSRGPDGKRVKRSERVGATESNTDKASNKKMRKASKKAERKASKKAERKASKKVKRERSRSPN